VPTAGDAHEAITRVGNCQVSTVGTKIHFFFFFGASNSTSVTTASRAGVGEKEESPESGPWEGKKGRKSWGEVQQGTRRQARQSGRRTAWVTAPGWGEASSVPNCQSTHCQWGWAKPPGCLGRADPGQPWSQPAERGVMGGGHLIPAETEGRCDTRLQPAGFPFRQPLKCSPLSGRARICADAGHFSFSRMPNI